MKRFLLLIFAIASFSFAQKFSHIQESYLVTYNNQVSVKDTGNTYFDNNVDSKTLIDEMGFGWNLGNTLDAFTDNVTNEGLSSETCWNNTKTTEQIIDGLTRKGFKTIRLPTTWHNHIIDDKYTLDPEWTKRVKEVVDMCLRKGLYVILNTHHDNVEDNVKYGTGYYPDYANREESKKFIANVWSQIVDAFNNGYDHHLIFEGLNEPRLRGYVNEWVYKEGDRYCEQGLQVLNEFNRLILEIIRKSGGNNKNRFLMFSPLGASYTYALAPAFQLPDDSQYNPSKSKVILSVHMYSPYEFAFNGDMNYVVFGDSERKELEEDFNNLYDLYVSKGHHVVIGEMGIINKNNLEERKKWAQYYVENTRKRQIACIVWDNGQWDNPTAPMETFGLYHRQAGVWDPDDLVDAYISAASTPLQ